MEFLKNKILATVTIAVVVTAVMAGLVVWNPLHSIHLRLSNFLYTRNEPSDAITIIAIDEKSLDPKSGLGAFKDWPRSYYAQLLEKIVVYKPAVVGFDLDFSKPSQGMSELRLRQLLQAEEQGSKLNYYSTLKDFVTVGRHPDDVYFQEMMGKVSTVLWLSTEVFQKEGQYIYKGDVFPIFSGKGIEYGFGKTLPDKDNIRRRTFLRLYKEDGSNEIVSFAWRVAKKIKPELSEYKEWDGKPMLINFAEKVNGYRKISFLDALTGKLKEEDVKGKIILVGASASILHDNYVVPNSKQLMPGVEVQANVVQQLLEGKFLREQRGWEQILTIGGLSLVGAFAMNFVPMIFSAVMLALAFALYSFSTKFFFDRGLVMNLVYPYIALVLTFFGSIMYRYLIELKEKRMVKAAFSHYVNKEVVTEILKHPEMLKLGGEKRRVSVLFSDIISFTSLAEKLPAEETVGLLNEYLDAMTRAIFAKGGTLDKFEGDAIMAFFGAPLAQPDHAKIACESALEMRKILAQLHEKWHRENKPILDFCVGIATGEAVVGNLGSRDRFDYTVIGDTVNLGSRLESINRLYGTKIIVDETTAAGSKGLLFRKLDRVRVKGKQTPTVIYELFVNSVSQTFLQDFGTGIKLYEEQHFDEAKKYFEAVLKTSPQDGPSQIYKNRCDYFLKTPPPSNWDFVVEIEQK